MRVRSELRQEPSCVTPRETPPYCTCLWKIEDLHGEEALKTIKEGAMVRKLSLSTGSACAITFCAAGFLCSCGRAPGTAVRQWWGALWLNGITSPNAQECGPQPLPAPQLSPPHFHWCPRLEVAGRVPVLAALWCPHLTHRWPAVAFFRYPIP